MPSLRLVPLARKKKSSTARTTAIELARLALARHCRDVVVLDLRGLSPVTDFFVIATGTSARQMASLAQEMSDIALSSPLSIDGLSQGSWVLLDLFDVVVHLFDADHRSYYDLEMLWGDAPRTRWKKPVKKTPAKH